MDSGINGVFNTNVVSQSNSLDSIFNKFKSIKFFFDKNKYPAKNSSVELLNFNFNKKNSVIQIYPNLVNQLLSGSMLINSKESSGSLNTNEINISDLSWNATDRFFLKTSVKFNLNLLRSYNYLKNTISSGDVTNYKFFKNSDHSDLNRWLKRG
jgi:hypothetical protein